MKTDFLLSTVPQLVFILLIPLSKRVIVLLAWR